MSLNFAAHWKNRIVMTSHRKLPPTSFMMAPAACWSDVTLMPHSRAGMS